MKLQYVFTDLQAEEHHRQFIAEEAANTVGKFEREKEFTVNAAVRKTQSKHRHSADNYECEITVKGDRAKGDVFIKKTDADFYVAIRKALAAAEKSLRRESATRASRRRKNYQKTMEMISEQLEHSA